MQAADKRPAPLKPIPDKLVVLTFDDGNKSDVTAVAPLLKHYGFGATFYVTTDWFADARRLNWDDLHRLHDDGFEIGNHSCSHPNFLNLTEEQIRNEISTFDKQCAEHGIEKATSFAYPGGHHGREVLSVLEEFGYTNARRGTDPEYPLLDVGGPGMVYNPREDDPFLIPSTYIWGTISTFDEVARAVDKAVDGNITVLTFHGVPDVHPHCTCPADKFRKIVEYLHNAGCTVVSMRDLASYVDFTNRPPDAFAPIKGRFGILAENLKCEYLVNPLGIDVPEPRFSWTLTSSRRGQLQAAYHILVASSRDKLDQNVGDIWDSGKVDSDRSVRRTVDRNIPKFVIRLECEESRGGLELY